MKNYSIEKVGSDYVVKVDDQQVMKLGSRRRAAQLVVDASELLDEVPLIPDPPHETAELRSNGASCDADTSPIDAADLAPSISRDSSEVA